ncbi:hypothetical protein ACP9OK_04925 [Pseudomonas sp. B11]
MAKLNSVLCWALPDSAARATPRGNSANPDTISADAPNHRFTEAFTAELALDFMLETRV